MPDGRPLNAAVLEAMRLGAEPQAAIDALIAKAPDFDAGFIAMSKSGAFGIGNMPSVLRRADQGAAEGTCDDMPAHVAALHNAIQPHRAIGILACEAALDAMRACGTARGSLILKSGLRISFGETPEIHVTADREAIRIAHPDANNLREGGSFGLGDRVRVVQDGRAIGWLGHEPFMVVRKHQVVSLDGKTALEVPVLLLAGH
jgi:hypothetical protein